MSRIVISSKPNDFIYYLIKSKAYENISAETNFKRPFIMNEHDLLAIFYHARQIISIKNVTYLLLVL